MHKWDYQSVGRGTWGLWTAAVSPPPPPRLPAQECLLSPEQMTDLFLKCLLDTGLLALKALPHINLSRLILEKNFFLRKKMLMFFKKVPLSPLFSNLKWTWWLVGSWFKCRLQGLFPAILIEQKQTGMRNLFSHSTPDDSDSGGPQRERFPVSHVYTHLWGRTETPVRLDGCYRMAGSHQADEGPLILGSSGYHAVGWGDHGGLFLQQL